jgi:hypothetical protein
MSRLLVMLPVPLSLLACAASPAQRSRPPRVAMPAPSARRLEPVAPPIDNAPAAHRPGGACAEDMVSLPTFCIDRYEAPNRAGELPYALKTAEDGETWCAERDKRLCTEDEWTRACEGPHGRRYPYGNEYRRSVCNDDRPWLAVHWDLLAKWPSDVAVDEANRLFQADRSGARAGCTSEEGVLDLTGNVAEWVRRSDVASRPGYEHVLKGCYWAGCYHEPHPNCAFRNSAHPGSFRTYEAGFRCCSDRGRTPSGPESTSSRQEERERRPGLDVHPPR